MPECNHKKQEGIFYCNNCGADLNLNQEEIDARDRMFPFMKSLIKHVANKDEYAAFDRQAFDYMIHGNGARIVIWILDMYAEEKVKEKKKKKEKTIIDIEKEKLKILKEIRNKL